MPYARKHMSPSPFTNEMIGLGLRFTLSEEEGPATTKP